MLFRSVVGFIKDYVPIPQLKLKPRKSDIRVLNLDFTSQFRQGDEIQEFNSNISLILKGTDQDEANILYSHASALLTFSPKGKDLSSDEKKKIFDLLLLGASIGDERGELGLTSLDRLFVFPYSDINRRIYGPALLLYGLEAISYDKREQY